MIMIHICKNSKASTAWTNCMKKSALSSKEICGQAVDGVELKQFGICNVYNVGSLFRWTICKVMVLHSRRECNHEYEDLVR